MNHGLTSGAGWDLQPQVRRRSSETPFSQITENLCVIPLWPIRAWESTRGPAPSPAPAHPVFWSRFVSVLLLQRITASLGFFHGSLWATLVHPLVFCLFKLEIKNLNKIKKCLLSSGGFPHHDLTGPPPLLFTGIPHRSSVSLASFWHLLAPLQSADFFNYNYLLFLDLWARSVAEQIIDVLTTQICTSRREKRLNLQGE